jgi:crossover junction endodeoxyribonuclease RuvC
MIIVGCDCGLANFGLAVVELDATSERVIALEVMRTRPTAKKHRVLAADDAVRRVRLLSGRLLALIGEHGPVAFCAEAMSSPRSASSAAKLAMSWGALATVAEVAGLPVVAASPQAIKVAVAGNGAASKLDVQAGLIERFGDAEMFDAINRGEREHAADALAAVVACLDSDVIRLARRLAA